MEQRVPPANVSDAHWQGTTFYAKYKINDMFEPTLRIEEYRDPDGFTTGVPQRLRGYTLTWNTKLALPRASILMIRPEIRYDRSSAAGTLDTKGAVSGVGQRNSHMVLAPHLSSDPRRPQRGAQPGLPFQSVLLQACQRCRQL
ncbi:outer membrane beta-barrel protein [Cupriavidus basilensis]